MKRHHAARRPDDVEAALSALVRMRVADLRRVWVEWFGDDGGLIIGAIAYHPSSLEWSYVILGRDIYGRFHALDLDTGLRDLEEARRLLVEKMTRAAAAGNQVLPIPPLR